MYKLDSDYIEAKAGDSPKIHFTLTPKTSLGENIKHVLTKRGEKVTKRFKIKGNDIIFNRVKIEDSEIYTISLVQDDKTLTEETFELDIAPHSTVEPGSSETGKSKSATLNA